MFVSAPFSLTVPAPVPVRRPYIAGIWERPEYPLGGESPTLVAKDHLSSAGAFHDIIFNNVMKCTYLRGPAPAPTLLERRKNTLDVARCRSLHAHSVLVPTLCVLAPHQKYIKSRECGGLRDKASRCPSPFPLRLEKQIQCREMSCFS